MARSRRAPRLDPQRYSSPSGGAADLERQFVRDCQPPGGAQPSVPAPGHCRGGHKLGQIRPAPRHPTGQSAISADLPRKRPTGIPERPLAVQTHVQTGSAISARPREPRRELPYTGPRLADPSGRQGPGLWVGRKRRVDIRQRQVANLETAIFDAGSDTADPGRRAVGQKPPPGAAKAGAGRRLAASARARRPRQLAAGLRLPEAAAPVPAEKIPSPASSIAMSAAVRIGCGSNCSVTAPPICTGRPSLCAARAANAIAITAPVEHSRHEPNASDQQRQHGGNHARNKAATAHLPVPLRTRRFCHAVSPRLLEG